MFRMLTLYYRTTCAFSRRVMAVVDRMQLEVELKNIEESDVLAELEAIGGIAKVPYLIDTAHAVSLYESDAIVAHLQTKYGKASVSAPRPRVHIADNVCISCEG